MLGPMEPSRRIHVPRLRRGELRIVARCTARVLANSNRTLDIITAEEIGAQTQLRALLGSGLFDVDDEARALYRDRPILARTDLAALRARPPHTLGGAFVRFLDDHGLDYALTDQPTPYTHDPDAAWLLHRLRQSHDLWHVLVGLGTRGHEEVLIHAFSLGQTGMPSSVLIASLGGVKHLLLERRWRDVLGLSRAFRLGRQARPLLGVYWERHWDEPVETVRARYRIETYRPQPVAA
jgi:ubiquinone biosynthesis protein COQ4